MSDFWRDRNVLVTGATGLVGGALVPELVRAGAAVTALVRDWDPQSDLIRTGMVSSISVVSGGLEDYADVERALVEHEIETVIHLGAQAIVGAAHRSPLETFESNIRGTYNLLDACRRQAQRVKGVVVASSDKAYGDSERLPYTEDMPPLGRHPYDVSKSCADLLSHAYFHTFGLPVVVARCGNIYGGGDLNWNRIVPGTIRSLHRGQRPVIRSDGTFTRDYVYVDDAVSAYLAMAEQLSRDEVRGEAFNFGPQKPHTVLEVVDVIRRLMGRMDLEPDVRNEAQAEIRHQYLCADKAKRVLGWTPAWPLEKGLRKTIDWYVQFLNARG
jgi:CDP-glucose 4,6-dehydratase